MKEITGYTMDEINRLGWYQSLYPDPEVREKAISRMAGMREGDDIIREEWNIKSRDATSKVINISTSILRKEVDSTYVMAVITDVSEQKANEDLLKKTNEQLRDLNASKDKFFSIMAHDLKTPLGAVVGVSELLTEALDSDQYDQAKHLAATLRKSVSRGYDLLVNLLEWARAQRGNIEFRPNWLNLYDLISGTADMLEEMAQKKKITLSNQIEPELWVYADKNMLDAMMRNLITNAIKYSFTENIVRIFSTREKSGVTIHVQDFGIGMSADVRDRLFKIDEHVSTYGTNNERGTGIGLLLCKEFADYHKGYINVESDEGQGSTFRIFLPEANIKLDNEPAQTDADDGEGAVVLIAEDEEINYLLLEALLKPMKCKILHAVNGREALDLCMKTPQLDVVLMDLKMPEMDGLTATRKIKEMKPGIPVIAQTAFELPFQSRKEFTAYLTKPINKTELIEAMQPYLK